MKKFILSALTASLLAGLLCLSVSVSAASYEDYKKYDNLIEEKNSTFDTATSITDTKWFLLKDANGDSSLSAATYNTGVTLKTDGGYSGKNYIQITAEQSWYSPSINIYPYLKGNGGGDYVISFWYRSSKEGGGNSNVMIRGKESDVTAEYDVNIKDAGNGNNYFSFAGKKLKYSSSWAQYISDPFTIDDEQLTAEKHNWWFCFDNVPANAAIDLDDFILVNADKYDVSDGAEEEDPDIVEGETGVKLPGAETAMTPVPAVKPTSAPEKPEATQKPSSDAPASVGTALYTKTKSGAYQLVSNPGAEKGNALYVMQDGAYVQISEGGTKLSVVIVVIIAAVLCVAAMWFVTFLYIKKKELSLHAEEDSSDTPPEA